MTHSKVWYDGDVYVTQVAHAAYENDLIDPVDYCPISGLLDYMIRPGDGVLKVYDHDDDETYEVHTIEDWKGLDKEAVQALLDAVDGSSEVLTLGKEFLRARREYRRSGDPVEALAGHKVGTVVRIEYDNDSPGDADIALKIGVDAWIMTGFPDVWYDDEIEEYDYEVIYSV